jgi:hypothetical protein
MTGHGVEAIFSNISTAFWLESPSSPSSGARSRTLHLPGRRSSDAARHRPAAIDRLKPRYGHDLRRLANRAPMRLARLNWIAAHPLRR